MYKKQRILRTKREHTWSLWLSPNSQPQDLFSCPHSLSSYSVSYFTEKMKQSEQTLNKLPPSHLPTTSNRADLVTTLLKTLTWIPITKSKSQNLHNDLQGLHHLGLYDISDLISTTLSLYVFPTSHTISLLFPQIHQAHSNSRPPHLLSPVTRTYPPKRACSLISQVFGQTSSS